MSSPGRVMFDYVSKHYPDVYLTILETIRPHSIKHLVVHFDAHIDKTFTLDHLSYFDTHREKIPLLCLRYVRAVRKKFPTPGDAFGINLTCRVTKYDTQGVLDKKHYGGSSQKQDEYNVGRWIKLQLQQFTLQSHVFEFSSKQFYFTVYLNESRDVFEKLPGKVCVLECGMPYNKGRDQNGGMVYLETFQFIYVRHQHKILYRTNRDLLTLYKRFDDIVAVSDIVYVYQRCGIVCFYFNLIRILRRQLFIAGCCTSSWVKDILTIVKYQCRSGKPLPLNRDGLAKNESKSPIEILSFEAPKKNLARLCTLDDESTKRYPVETSADKIFYGQQINEGTGYCGFAVVGGKNQA
jgi:hypothetical protein